MFMSNHFQFEVCIDSVQSAINAEIGGASRVELCANLLEGGTTPTPGMLARIKKTCALPVFVMIRPRGGDFLYSDDEFQIMKEDIRILKEYGADGIVFGILTSDGKVDVERCKEIVSLCRPLPITFHRAFDMIEDFNSGLNDVIELGVGKI